jgi:hypothetical protein
MKQETWENEKVEKLISDFYVYIFLVVEKIMKIRNEKKSGK